MKTIRLTLTASCLASFFLLGHSAQGSGPLPEFTFQGIALHPKDLSYVPTKQLVHPTIVNTEGRVENPLGKY